MDKITVEITKADSCYIASYMMTDKATVATFADDLPTLFERMADATNAMAAALKKEGIEVDEFFEFSGG